MLGILCLALAGSAFAMQASGPVPDDSPISKTSRSAHPAAWQKPVNARKGRSKAPDKNQERPPNPFDASPQPATVTLKNGELTIKANNSDLGQILRSLSDLSGMAIEGLDTSDRIFGMYGPGNPSEVLTALLSGSRYNFVIVGDRSNGAPRRLLLTAKTGKAPTAAEVRSNAPPAAAETPPTPPPTATLPPGVAPEKEDTEEDRTKRIQQMLRRLKTQHDQQQQNASPQ